METSNILVVKSHARKRQPIGLSIVGMFLMLTACQPDASKKAVHSAESLCWKDIRIGELPPQGAYDGIDSLVKKWNLCYERIETGCEVTDSITQLQKEYERSNAMYFKSLEKKLGKNWKKQFDQELHRSDSIHWIKINREIDRLNH
ncbi:hypothetical protein EG346_18900 [Chryseobacterium carnipullorum]|uniref:Uncharacterized protein n=1 Tax=Chryseobacterium carnipullorum TaxID=1124835 RepID=A0A376DZ37_CHRCU|nr:hypothetical protein [Chryseobacterium carnipullorum]MDN5476284.1 hypothetical protein [Chryseobacterium sp.]AZA50119.1 hypothetical protein EG346_18900 [Chryseobacterium carnipullorum]AZA64995.1 hypothetical protein EG345_09940 [Chryseobacterium carnipullorum]STC97247.1 Uncharacterised protein [Chryseobacterium carnipullorum]HBV17068.1 hypothetical protein [Chryseobacterium carnipullorum]